jgi:hypothetical protein
MKVKKWLIILSLSIGVISSCEKEERYQSSGVITGPDMRFCACCGGYFIEIEDSNYNFETLPSSSGIDLLKDTFPINVNLDWTFERDCGGIQYIEITKIVKR